MAFMRRCLFDAWQRAESTNEPETTLGDASISVIRPGFAFKSFNSDATGGGASNDFYTSNPVGVVVGDVFQILVGGVLNATISFTVNTIVYEEGNLRFKVNATGVGPSSFAYTAGDRVVLASSQKLTIYKDEMGDASLVNPVLSNSSSGAVEFFVASSQVDLLIVKAGVTSRYVLALHLGEHEEITPDDFPMGSGDEAELINRAIDVSHAQGVIPIKFTRQYTIATSVVPRGETILRGQGLGTGLICNTNAINCIAPVADTHNWRCEQFKIDASGAGTAGHGVLLPSGAGSSRVALEDLWIDGCSSGIYAQVAPHLAIDGCLVDGSDQMGIKLESASLARVMNTTIVDSGGAGLSIDISTIGALIGPNVYNNNAGGSVVDNGNNTRRIPSMGDDALYGVELGDISMSAETETANTTVTIGADTVFVDLTAFTASIQYISQCIDTRLIFVHNGTALPIALLHNVTGSPTDNELYLDNEKDIVLRPGGGVTLIGRTISGNEMWTPLGDSHRRFHDGYASQAGSSRVGSGTSTLATMQVPANTLQAAGDTLRISASGKFITGGGIQSLEIWANTSLIASYVSTGGSLDTHIECELTQTGVTAEQIASFRAWLDNTLGYHTVDVAVAEDETSDIYILIKGTNDVMGGTVTLHRTSVDAQVE